MGKVGESKLDPDKLKEYAKNVFGALGGAMTSSMIYLGDRLGLYSVLAGSGPTTSAELAERSPAEREMERKCSHRFWGIE